MQALSSALRSQLERTVIAARDLAEEGACAALERLAVNKAEALSHMSPEARELRVKLRAKGRQLGDRRQQNGEQEVDHLLSECAYEYWHQMLFARFLAENQLLMHPDGVAVTLEECEELAAEEGTDGWTLAARYASRMLPQIFRPDDPLLGVTFAPEDKQALETLLADLPVEVFTADDSLGWVYQFWQTKRKKEVNDSGEKIGADELPAVTQLFTEDYMVKFLLHNTLGAWWAGKRLTAEDAESAETEEELRQKVALPGVGWEYLRFIRGADGKGGPWRPAAGTFPGWPKQAAELKIMDPCCGSGHFLVAAFDLMVRIRMEEDVLEAAQACDVVLRDNLFGLEINQRCTQIAAFALAVAAWRLCGEYRPLSAINIACSGIAPHAKKDEWVELAGDEQRMRGGMESLYELFQDAPTLGSLISPKAAARGYMYQAAYDELCPILEKAITGESHDDFEHYELGIAGRGIADAARLLAGHYHLVITNVPYLTRGKQDDVLKYYIEQHHKPAKQDLATAFVERCLAFSDREGSAALVTPQNWLFLGSYRKLREKLLKGQRWELVAKLGAKGFQTPMWDFNVMLIVLSRALASEGHPMAAIDASEPKKPKQKARLLQSGEVKCVSQEPQLRNPDARITLAVNEVNELIGKHAETATGLQTFDRPRFILQYWEISQFGDGWEPCQSTVASTRYHGGCEYALLWEDGNGQLHQQMEDKRTHENYTSGIWRAGSQFWGRKGVLVSLMNDLPASIYCGYPFDQNAGLIVPSENTYLPALWAYCSSPQFGKTVREVDQALKVTNATLGKIPISWSHWEKVAAEKYPDGLPKPYSDDATQWIFHGRPEQSADPLQVAVARLLGYRWPAELNTEMELSDEARALVRRCDELLPLADDDGIVCIPAVAGERTAADRLLALLSKCAVKADHDLDAWLRDDFFVEHCQLFQQRPFIWHIWDGRRKDGFHALVNYHKLDRKLLEKLIYTHLGDWIGRQKAAEGRGESGAEGRRQDAEKLQDRLKLILAGEPPYDIFIRWKPLEEQPIGWDPDLNDGVRINIRPFVEAGVLRKNPRINWKKDRGKDPESAPWYHEFGGDRINDHHLSFAEKRDARAANPPAPKEPRDEPAAEDDEESDYEPVKMQSQPSGDARSDQEVVTHGPPDIPFWKMTRREYHEYKQAQGERDSQKINREYYGLIMKAVSEGKPVDSCILDQYRHLRRD